MSQCTNKDKNKRLLSALINVLGLVFTHLSINCVFLLVVIVLLSFVFGGGWFLLCFFWGGCVYV